MENESGAPGIPIRDRRGVAIAGIEAAANALANFPAASRRRKRRSSRRALGGRSDETLGSA
jgi:hypothetical protein